MDAFTAASIAEKGVNPIQAAINSAYSVHESRQSRRFQRYMSNTAHQREIADLKAAGINPMLTVMGGRGASTPSGAHANIPQPVNSALSAMDIRLKRAQIRQQDAVSRGVELDNQKKELIAKGWETGDKVITPAINRITNEIQNMEAPDIKKLKLQDVLEGILNTITGGSSAAAVKAGIDKLKKLRDKVEGTPKERKKRKEKLKKFKPKYILPPPMFQRSPKK